MAQKITMALSADGDFLAHPKFITGLEQIAQRVYLRLHTLKGTWFVDRSVGLDYLNWLSEKSVQAESVAALLSAEIQATEGVLSVFDVTVSLDNDTMTLSVSGKVDTVDGQLEIQGDLNAADSSSPALVVLVAGSPIVP